MTPEHRGIVKHGAWLWLTMAHTVVAILQWSVVLEFARMRRAYPSAVLAAAHFHEPPGMMAAAVGVTITSALLWALVIWRAER